MKKLFSVLLTLILSLCMINKVSANTTGSITVNGTKEDKTYEIYKIFDLTLRGSGDNAKVAYTIDSDWHSFFKEGGLGESYIVDTNSGNLNQIVVNNEVKYINITESNVAEFTQKALTYAASKQADKSAIATGSTLKFEGLQLGYYLVYPKGATDKISETGSICSITATVPDSSVDIKATYPTIIKEVDDSNAEVGQIVTFTITGKVPDTTGFNTYIYQINDTMTTGLLFNESIAKLTVTIDGNPISVTPNYINNGFSLNIDVINYQQYVGKDIVVTYKAQVTKDAILSTTTENKASLTYSNDPKTDETTKTPDIIIKVYSSVIKVTKVDGDNTDTKLEGASFVLKNSKGEYYQAIIDETTQELTDVNWVTDITKATEYTTNDNGIVEFKGIENGTYNLVETKAPEGYNKLTEEVTIKAGYKDETGSNLVDIAVTQETTVNNFSGQRLPSTGGIGTKLFIIIGSLLTISSAIILITNKRISKEDL